MEDFLGASDAQGNAIFIVTFTEHANFRSNLADYSLARIGDKQVLIGHVTFKISHDRKCKRLDGALQPAADMAKL